MALIAAWLIFSRKLLTKGGGCVRFCVMKIQPIQARDVRAKLLARSDWIIESSIRAACGYTPRLPPDMVDFTGNVDEHRMVPEMRPLTDLLKAIMPKMDLQDDLMKIAVEQQAQDDSNKYQKQSEKVIAMALGGHISTAQALNWVNCMTPMMENEARMKIVKAMEALN